MADFEGFGGLSYMGMRRFCKDHGMPHTPNETRVSKAIWIALLASKAIRRYRAESYRKYL